MSQTAQVYAVNLARAREEVWLAQELRQAEAHEAAWAWDEAVAAWETLAARRPDDPGPGARLARAREEQALEARAQDAADLAEQAEWEGVLAMVGELAQQREGYTHPRIDLAALRRRAEAVLAHERAVELAEQGDWLRARKILSTVPEGDRTEEMAEMLTHTKALALADIRRRNEQYGRQREEQFLALVEMAKSAQTGGALAQLRHLTADTDRKFQVAWLAARLAETADVPFDERLKAAQLAGELGDPRVPMAPAEWARELGRRDERFGAQPWAALPPPYWCHVPAGQYLIGGWGIGEKSATLALKAFWIARLPITVAQYAPFVAEGYGPGGERWWTPEGWRWRQEAKRTQPLRWGEEKYSGANQPVIGVSWHEAMAYCAWLTARLGGELPVGCELRLPSEAEWETAASFEGRGTRRPFPWGPEPPTPERAIYDASKVGRPTPVGCCPAGAAACGALDIAGNVWEMQASENRAYPAGSHTPQQDLTSGRMSWRGGSWYNDETCLRCGARDWNQVNLSYDNHDGFRVVLAPPLVTG